MDKKATNDAVNDILKVLKEIDFAISPIIPTDKMCRAGAEIGSIDSETAKRVYIAMLLSAAGMENLAYTTH